MYVLNKSHKSCLTFTPSLATLTSLIYALTKLIARAEIHILAMKIRNNMLYIFLMVLDIFKILSRNLRWHPYYQGLFTFFTIFTLYSNL